MKISSHAMRVFLLASVLVSATVLLLPFTEPAQAEGTAYVSNMGQPSFSSTTAVSLTGNNRAVSQKFTTGTLTDATATFALAGVEMNLARVPALIDGTTFKITLQTVDNSGNPFVEIFQFENPDPVVQPREQFAAPSGTQLAQNTSYAIVVEYASDETPPRFRRTQRHNEDSGAASGWSIDNQNKVKGSGGSWGQGGGPLKIKVLETQNNFPTASDGTVETNEGTAYTFEERDFGFVDSDDSLDHVKITSLPGTGEGTLSLNSSAVAVDDEVSQGDINGGKLQYTPPASGSGRAFTSFKFKVSDGLDDSAEYDMSINVYVALVSNLGQEGNDDGYDISITDNDQAQAFTTGSNPKGYHLGSFELDLRDFRTDLDNGNSTTTVFLYSSTSNSPDSAGNPDTVLCTLVHPDGKGAGIFTFAAPASCPTMLKATVYFVVVVTVVSDTNQPYVNLLWEVTVNDAEDATPADGWSIYDKRHQKGGSWGIGAQNHAFQMGVNGEAIPNARPTTAVNPTVTTNEDMTYTFTEANFGLSDDDNDGTDDDDTLHAVITSLPDAGTLWFDVDGADDQMGNNEAVSLDDKVVETDLGKLKYTPPANAHSDEDTNGVLLPFTTFGFKVNDGYEDSTLDYTMTVNVTAVNDAPVVTGLEAITVAENTADDTILATYTATDVEGDTLTWTLRETESGIDDSNEFSVVYGRLYFASERNYENAKDENTNNVYEVRVLAYDGDEYGGLDIAVTVTDVNDAPVAVDDTYSTNEDTALVIPVSNAALEGVLDNDMDEDVDTLSVTEVTDPPNGAATLANDKTTITYTPSTGFAGIDTFDYAVSDGSDNPALTDTGTVTVKVRPAVAGDDSPSFAENGTGSVATYTAAGNPAWSLEETGDYLLFSIDASDGVLTFNSPPDFENPTDADTMNDYNVTVVATVGSGDSTVSGSLAVIVSVTDVNEAPAAVNDYAFTSAPTAVAINVVDNDTDVDAGTTLSVTEVGTPANGDTELDADTNIITYTPDDGFAGYDTFTYTVSDDDANDPRTDTGTVTVSVKPEVSSDAPDDDAISYAENGTGPVATFTANGNPTWRLTGDDSGDFSIDRTTGVLTFNSPPDYESPADEDGGNDYLVTVVATVQSGGSTVTGTLVVTVSVSNLTELTGLTQVDYAENGTGSVATYTTGGSPTWTLLGADSAKLSISDAAGVLIFASVPNYEMPADANTDNVYEVTVQATEGAGDDAVTATLDVTVTVTDLPGVSGPVMPEYAENGTAAVGTYSASGSHTWDLSGADSAKFSISAGVLTFNNSPNYESPASADGDNDYQVTVRSTEGAEVSTLDVTVRVLNLADVPTAVDDSFNTEEDMFLAITRSQLVSNDRMAEDPENTDHECAILCVNAVGTGDEGPSNGTASVNPEQAIIYTPADHFNGTDRFTYRISDGTNTATGTVTVTVTQVNDAPTAVNDTVVTVAGTAIVIDVVANDTDVDGDALRVSAVGDANNGNAERTARSSTEITYAPIAAFSGDDSFSYTVTDGTATDTGMVSVTVESVTVGDLVDLSALTVTSGSGNETVELNEEFAENTTAYTLNVPNSVSSLRVNPKKKFDTSDDDNPDTAANVVVEIKVNGMAVDSGNPIPVSAGGVTNIEIEVIATISPSDGAVAQVSQTYTIRVTRPARPTSSNANLAALTVSDGALDTDFDSGITDYSMTVANSVDSISLDLRAAHDGATVVVTANGVEVPADNIPLTEGGITVITVVVTAQDGTTTRTYTITVTRAPSANADLAGLAVSDGALDTDFDSGITDYSMTVANSVDSISLDLRAVHDGATVVVTANGVEAPADNIPLTEGGITVITVVVTAQDGTTTRTYTITVTRAPSANADLAGLTVSGGALDTDFDSGITDYSMTVADSVDSISLDLRAVHDGATVVVTANGVEVPADNIPLTEGGTTVVTLLVTAQDGTTTRTYTIRVTRASSSLSANADLVGLTISVGSLDTDFEPGITSYSVAVANSVSSVSVFPRAANADATVVVKVNGVEAPGTNVPLTEGGATVITVVVTSQDGSTSKTYTITVFRAARVSVGRGGGGSVSRNLTPSFVEGSQTIRSVAENTPGGANIGAPIVATGSTGDRLSYALLGADAPLFDIDAAAGQLLTNGPLDFESKSGYRVSVSVSNSRGGRDTIAVTINLTNVDEPGTVAVLPAQPTVGRAMTAVLTDPDGGVTGITWQWAVSSDQVVWLDIPGATSDTYSPVADDGGKYLRAMAFYTDGEGTGKSAQATWDTPLAAPPAPASTMTPEPTGAGPSSEPTRAASPATMTTPAPTPTAAPTTPTAIPSAAVVPTPAPAAGVPATSALEQAADDNGIDLWVILLIAAVVAAVAVGLIILGVRIIRA